MLINDLFWREFIVCQYGFRNTFSEPSRCRVALSYTRAIKRHGLATRAWRKAGTFVSLERCCNDPAPITAPGTSYQRGAPCSRLARSDLSFLPCSFPFSFSLLWRNRHRIPSKSEELSKGFKTAKVLIVCQEASGSRRSRRGATNRKGALQLSRRESSPQRRPPKLLWQPGGLNT